MKNKIQIKELTRGMREDLFNMYAMYKNPDANEKLFYQKHHKALYRSRIEWLHSSGLLPSEQLEFHFRKSYWLYRRSHYFSKLRSNNYRACLAIEFLQMPTNST